MFYNLADLLFPPLSLSLTLIGGVMWELCLKRQTPYYVGAATYEGILGEDRLRFHRRTVDPTFQNITLLQHMRIFFKGATWAVLLLIVFKKYILINLHSFLQNRFKLLDSSSVPTAFLSPGPPGSGGARVTLGVILREPDWQSASLMVREPREEVVHDGGELSGDLVPLLWIFFYVKEHHGLQRVRLWRRWLRAVVVGPGEPHVTAWRKDVSSRCGQ